MVNRVESAKRLAVIADEMHEALVQARAKAAAASIELTEAEQALDKARADLNGTLIIGQGVTTEKRIYVKIGHLVYTVDHVA